MLKMLNRRVFRLIRDQRLSVPFVRSLHREFTQPEPKKEPDDNVKKLELREAESRTSPEEKLTGALSQKYKVFREEDSPEILDIYEERERYQMQDEPDEVVDEFSGLNLKRGLTGVFDIEQLIDVLRAENAEDVFVCSVPKEIKYTDYMVVCSGRSYRHMFAIADFVRRVYKKKRLTSDTLPRIEGEKSRDWMALDLGNIALHIFSPIARESYDLESLWSIGSKYDRECNKPEDPMVELFEKHSILFSDTKPQQ